MDFRLKPLADVIVKILVREILEEKSHRGGETHTNGGFEDVKREQYTRKRLQPELNKRNSIPADVT